MSIKLDTTELRAYMRRLTSNKSHIGQAVAQILTAQAEHHRHMALAILKQELIFRGTFAERQMVAYPARGGQISTMVATSASLGRDRFGGWAAQLGEPEKKRERTPQLKARRGNVKNVITQRARLKTSNEVRSIRGRAVAGLQPLIRSRYKGLISIGREVDDWPGRHGVYMLSGRVKRGSKNKKVLIQKLNLVQTYETPRVAERVDWQGIAIIRALADVSMEPFYRACRDQTRY